MATVLLTVVSAPVKPPGWLMTLEILAAGAVAVAAAQRGVSQGGNADGILLAGAKHRGTAGGIHPEHSPEEVGAGRPVGAEGSGQVGPDVPNGGEGKGRARHRCPGPAADGAELIIGAQIDQIGDGAALTAGSPEAKKDVPVGGCGHDGGPGGRHADG